MYPELRAIPEYETEDAFFTESKEQESFFTVSPDSSMTCMFPYYSIEAVTHVIGKASDLRKKETLSIVLSGQQSVIIQGCQLCKIRFAIQARNLRHLRQGYKKAAEGSDTPFIIASIEVPTLGRNS